LTRRQKEMLWIVVFAAIIGAGYELVRVVGLGLSN
jgi:hypothetical protein